MRSLLLLIAGTLSCLATALSNETTGTGPAPSWIAPPPALSLNASPNDGGYRYHLVDFQHHLETNEQYSHIVVSIISPSGVQTFSKLDFNYIPDYQRFTLHHLTITRNGETQDRLTQTRIETLRREEGMNQDLYDGELTALIILEDIRPGDVLSYAYTVHGSNPVLGDIHHKFISTAYSDPIDHMRRRVLWSPQRRSLQWLHHGASEPQAASQTHGELQELLWEKHSVARVTPEENTPSWHDDYPSLEYSDCRDWKQFHTWASGLYSRNESLPAEAIQVCEQIRTQYPDEETRIGATLQWVQTHIRYLGSFFGEHTHEPYPLQEIWKRQFGDCKDKTMLTIAMLRHLGHDAAPALVNSDLASSIGDCLPGPSLFNHVVVHLRWNNNDYYLDPTRSYERGPLRSRSVTDYGYVFQIRPNNHALTAVDPPPADIGKTVIRETYTVNDMHGDAQLHVETTATGQDANGLRSYFSSTAKEEIIESYRKFYANDFPDIESSAAIDFDDDPTSGKITVRENYRIPQFWRKDETNNRWHCFINSSYLRTSLKFPKVAKRTAPYHHRFPLNIEQSIHVNLPESWNTTPSTVTINNPAFRFHSTTKSSDKTILIHHEYTSLADHVRAKEFSEFSKSMKQVENDLSTEIWHYAGITNETKNPSTDEAPTKPNFKVVAITLIIASGTAGLLIAGIICALLWLWNPPPRTPLTHQYVGIGGWLILPTIGLFLTPILIIYQFCMGLSDTQSMSQTLAGIEGISLWHFYYATNFVTMGAIVAIDILLLVLFFTRRTSFPWVFIAFGIFTLASNILLFTIETHLPNLDQPSTELPMLISRSVIHLIIWGSYMLLSERVKATFSRQRGMQLTPPPTPPPLPTIDSPPTSPVA